MSTYILRRILIAFPVLLGITIVELRRAVARARATR